MSGRRVLLLFETNAKRAASQTSSRRGRRKAGGSPTSRMRSLSLRPTDRSYDALCCPRLLARYCQNNAVTFTFGCSSISNKASSCRATAPRFVSETWSNCAIHDRRDLPQHGEANLLQPTPLWTPVYWGAFFASMHAVQICAIPRDNSEVTLSEREHTLYEQAFLPHGFTPRQFLRIMECGSFVTLTPGDACAKQGEPVKALHCITSCSQNATVEMQQESTAPDGDQKLRRLDSTDGVLSRVQPANLGGGLWVGEVWDPGKPEHWARASPHQTAAIMVGRLTYAPLQALLRRGHCREQHHLHKQQASCQSIHRRRKLQAALVVDVGACRRRAGRGRALRL